MCRLIRAANRDKGDAILLIDPIFIVGVPRSGTTLVQSLLSRSPDAYSLPETHFFEGIMPKLGKGALQPLTEAELAQALSLLEDLMSLKAVEEEQRALVSLAARQELTGKKVFEWILERYRPAWDTDARLRVIEKTPLHVEKMEEILTLYPTARFVHVLRDPRNAISSVLRTPFVATAFLPWHAQRWNLVLHLVERFQRLAPGRILTIRYEDLTESPEPTLRQVCTFVGLRFEAEMLRPTDDQAAPTFLADREPWKAGVLGEIRRPAPRQWERRLQARQAWLIERYTGRRMVAWGYQPDTRVSMADRVKMGREIREQLKRDPRTVGWCISMADRCAQAGDRRGAARLAREVVLSNWRHLFNPTVRRLLLGACERALGVIWLWHCLGRAAVVI